MERSFKSVLDYIKNFFSVAPVDRVQRRTNTNPTFESPGKLRNNRYSPYSIKSPVRIIPIEREFDDISPYLLHKPDKLKRSLNRINLGVPMKQAKVKDTIVIDDDDDNKFTRSKQNRLGKVKSFTSTPADKSISFKSPNSYDNDTDDLILVKSSKPSRDKQLDAKLAGFDYLKPKSATGAVVKDKLLKNQKATTNGTTSAMNYSFQLEDKLQYKKLLEKSYNDSSFYQTPVGKLLNTYDLTGDNKKGRSPLFGLNRTPEQPKNTRDTIISLLDGMENDSAIIKGSDSEDSVIIVNPPSPKPDIKVDPINSFKKIVDCSKATKKDWLDEIAANHKQVVDERQREIDSLQKYCNEFEKINKDMNIEILKRKIDDCLKFKEVILPEKEPVAELPQLTEEQLAMVQTAFRGNPNEVLTRKFNLNITRRDLMTLAGLNWLNDEVINFYMNLISERGKDSHLPNTHTFNTFFYPKLIRDGSQSLKRWTKKIDLFSYDLICIPIHLGMHWCMAIIDFRDKSIRYYDSMGSPNKRCLAALRQYLEAEHKDKKGIAYDTSDFHLENMADIPQQMNGSDCGMFACTFAEFISRNSKITFSQEDMPYLRKKMVVEIMTGELLIK